MVAIDLSIIGKLEEKPVDLRFRDECHIKISKMRRKKGYTSSLEIVIDSINYNLYENGKGSPAIQFYGYAVLVLESSLTLEIPIHYPRQNLYEAVQWEAIRQWRGWVEFYIQYQLHRKNDISLATIMGALEIPYEESEVQIKENEWIELPLREVHVKCVKGTQFKILHSQWQPVSFVDPITGVAIDGESSQSEEPTEEGLPSNGIQPKRNPSDDPFQGNEPVSGFEEIGLSGFELLSPYNLTDVVGDTPPPPPPPQQSYRLSYSWRTVNNSCGVITSTISTFDAVASSPSDISISLGDLSSVTCGRDLRFMRITVAGVVVTERAGGGNSAFEIASQSVALIGP